MALDFTTLARVRRVLGFGDDDLTQDDVLGRLIKAVSREMERNLSRHSLSEERVEVKKLWPSSNIIWFKGVPIASSPAPVLLMSVYRDFVTSPTALAAGVDYVLEPDTGLVRFIIETFGIRHPTSGWPKGPTYVQATYTGGMAADTPAFMAAYPDLSEMAEMQVAYLFQRQKTPGGNITVGPSSTSFDTTYGLLPSVRSAIESYKQRNIY